jgi:hypothetical protein
MTTTTIKAPTVTLTFTREQLSDLLGALNAASLASRKQAKRTKNVERAQVREIMASDYDHLFCTVVRARQQADAKAQAAAEAQGDDGLYREPMWSPCVTALHPDHDGVEFD